MKTVFCGITFAAFEYCFLIPFVIAICFLSLKRLAKVKRVAHLLTGMHRGLLRNYSYPKQVVRTCLVMLGILFLWMTLLRPQWNELEETVQHEGRDVLVALDISRSMLATDVEPNRITAAKDKIRLLVKTLGSDRVGLILFSGSAFVHCPFTADYNAFESFLDLVNVELFSTGTTAVDNAISQALRVFERTPYRKTKICVLFTDGEDFSTNLHMLKDEARQKEMQIVAVGVGTVYGAPIPQVELDGKQKGHLLDSQGSVVISRLNESMLAALTQDIGGLYVRMSQDDTDVKTILSYIESFEKESFEDKMVTQLQDQYPWFALGSFICLLIEWLL